LTVPGSDADQHPHVLPPIEEHRGESMNLTAPSVWQAAVRSRLTHEEMFDQALNEMARAFTPDDPGRVLYTTLTLGFSAGYLLMNLRNLYLLAGFFLARPLWNPLDPLAVLDEDAGGEEELEPIIGTKKRN
jgi:hypothetical protein